MPAEGVVAVKYVAKAKRWERGWELHVDGVGVTQVRLLKDARAQVRDLVETVTGKAATGVDIVVADELGDLVERVARAKQMTAAAERAQLEAAAEARALARALREQGLSVSDSAEILGVSRGRVSQLLA